MRLYPSWGVLSKIMMAQVFSGHRKVLQELIYDGTIFQWT